MSSINLAEVSNDEFKTFLDSFDNVLCDCDGVIWHTGVLIPGVDHSLSKLKKTGKTVRFVTNNSYLGLDKFCDRLKQLNIDAEPSDVANPCLAIINHLKKIEFSRPVCVLGSSYFKEEIRDAGFNVVDMEIPTSMDDSTQNALAIFKELIIKASSIGAFIFDIDLNLNYVKLSTVLGCLQNPNVLFLTACNDRAIPLAPKMYGIGPEYFIKPVQDLSGREAIAFGKPSSKMSAFFVEKFKLDDPSRTLFIGDSLQSDIEFASKLGYQTLLVLTGNTKLEDVKSCTNKDNIPNFYLKSLGDLHEVIRYKLDL